MENQAEVPNKKPTAKDKKPMSAKDAFQGIAGIVVIVLILWGLYAIFFGGSGKKASYQGTVDTSSFNIVNPATLGVSFHVKNTGNAPGAPYCTLQVNDVNDTYSGTDAFTLKTIQPGQTVTSVDNVTITKQGAQYVTDGTITCN